MATKALLTKHQKEIFAEKILEWGNLVFIGLVIAQFVPGIGPLKVSYLLAGLANFAFAYLVAYYITKK